MEQLWKCNSPLWVRSDLMPYALHPPPGGGVFEECTWTETKPAGVVHLLTELVVQELLFESATSFSLGGAEIEKL
jgi:hypothetical protein